MNKAQLIEQVAERLETSRKDASEAVEAVFAAITDSVSRGERVAISGFGIFEQVFRQARIGRNPRTGETVKIGAVTLPKFRPGRDFKNLVSGAREATRKATGREAAEAPAEEKATAAAAKTTAAAKKATGTAKRTTTTAAKKTTAAAAKTTTAAKKTTTTAAKKTTATARKAAPAAAKKATAAKATTPAKKAAPAKKTTAAKKAAPAE